MTVDELRHCATITISLAARNKSLEDEDKRLYQAALNVQRASNAIDAARASVDVRDRKQVEAFTKEVESNQRMVIRYNEAVRKRNDMLRQANDEMNEFNVLCANRPWSEGDLALLPDDQQRAMRQGAQTITIPLLQPGSAGSNLTVGGVPVGAPLVTPSDAAASPGEPGPWQMPSTFKTN